MSSILCVCVWLQHKAVKLFSFLPNKYIVLSYVWIILLWCSLSLCVLISYSFQFYFSLFWCRECFVCCFHCLFLWCIFKLCVEHTFVPWSIQGYKKKSPLKLAKPLHLPIRLYSLKTLKWFILNFESCLFVLCLCFSLFFLSSLCVFCCCFSLVFIRVLISNSCARTKNELAILKMRKKLC